ncbi:hypothetical protein Syun_028241 [Stephania yunnanensis]|uniref:Uncharacterized protein n=1 Tax=Stephania yunnanensis TaxID=152371 RepID=A0AAP0HRY6_9MAGN
MMLCIPGPSSLSGKLKFSNGFGRNSVHKRRGYSLPCINCENKNDESFRRIKVERPPYHVYYDSTSGQLEPASGARASIPGPEYWPEGTADQVRAARAPEPKAKSSGVSSNGQKPGSRRRRKAKAQMGSAENAESSVELSESIEIEIANEEAKDMSNEYVVYQTEPEEEKLSEFELDKRLGKPHPFIDPKVKKPIEGSLSSEELWWNWRKPEKEQWSRWQRRRPDVETVFLKAMAETGQVKLYGDTPTQTETSLYRARRHLYKDERNSDCNVTPRHFGAKLPTRLPRRLQAEQERLERIGPIAYYSEWVSAWKKDTSREAVQKHFEETGEDENTQLITMFQHQTAREYRIMMGTDIRIKRDPMAMRMREDQIKEIWGGDPVYPTINYIQDPDAVIDYRGPDFHEPTPEMLPYLMESEDKRISQNSPYPKVLVVRILVPHSDSIDMSSKASMVMVTPKPLGLETLGQVTNVLVPISSLNSHLPPSASHALALARPVPDLSPLTPGGLARSPSQICPPLTHSGTARRGFVHLSRTAACSRPVPDLSLSHAAAARRGFVRSLSRTHAGLGFRPVTDLSALSRTAASLDGDLSASHAHGGARRDLSASHAHAQLARMRDPQGKVITREELEKILAKEKTEELELTDMDEAMAQAVDIGENEDDEEASEVENDDEGEEKITRNWSVVKSTPELGKSKHLGYAQKTGEEQEAPAKAIDLLVTALLSLLVVPEQTSEQQGSTSNTSKVIDLQRKAKLIFYCLARSISYFVLETELRRLSAAHTL